MERPPPRPCPAARQGLWSLLTLQRSSHVPHRVDHMGPTLRGPHGCFWSPLLLHGPAHWPSCSLAGSNPVYSGDPCTFPPFGLHVQCCPGGARSVQRQHTQVWEEQCRPKTLGFLKKQ